MNWGLAVVTSAHWCNRAHREQVSGSRWPSRWLASHSDQRASLLTAIPHSSSQSNPLVPKYDAAWPDTLTCPHSKSLVMIDAIAYVCAWLLLTRFLTMLDTFPVFESHSNQHWQCRMLLCWQQQSFSLTHMFTHFSTLETIHHMFCTVPFKMPKQHSFILGHMPAVPLSGWV